MIPHNHSRAVDDDLFFWRTEFAKAPDRPPTAKISQYVEGKRILPTNTPFPGFWLNSRTPYSVEIMDNMSPHSPIQHTVVMKGAQLGLTAAAENVVAYWMDEIPAELLYISATENLLLKWSTKRLEPLIDSCGYRHKIYAQTENKGSRRTGDKIFIKEFVGGTLDMASAQSAASLRSDSKRVLIRDEIDGAPAQLNTGEGNWLDVSFVRTNAYGDRRKVLDISTPTTVDKSQIFRVFKEGDQREFFVPCPHCDKEQSLKWKLGGTYGIRGETEAGKLSTVYYLCEFCNEAIFNHHKAVMLPRGVWRPTKRSSSATHRSYYLPSLYSPVGMLTWFKMYEEYLRAQEDPDGMRSFETLYVGWPYKETGTRPKLERVLENKGTYKSRTVPDGVLFLTAAVDVQRGSERDASNPARLEMEICGHGAGWRTASIAYERFEGPIDDMYEGAWKLLREYSRETKMTFFRESDGRPFPVELVFVDSTDGVTEGEVYRFTQTWKNTYPTKGFSSLSRRKNETVDKVGPHDKQRYRRATFKGDVTVFTISGPHYKNMIYNNLKIQRTPDGEAPPKFCDFPCDYTEDYFKMLTAEERLEDGSFVNTAQRRNEALDLRVLNLAAADVLIDGMLEELKQAAIKAGATKAQLERYDSRRVVIDHLKKRAALQR